MQYSSSEDSNPYVGPRPFRIGETLYGRDQESKALVQLLIPERIVLLHSPSGAGKTSLIQARLVPYLETEGFSALPVIEVGSHPLSKQVKPRNRYVLSALVRLESNLPAKLQMPFQDLAKLTMLDYLKERLADSQRAVLIFDQFEEILTQDPTDTDVKHDFFEQIGEVLSNRYRWALFAIREEYIGALEPYQNAVPTRLKTTFRLNLLTKTDAVEAIQKPARQHDVDFLDEAANQLVDDLRTRRILGSNGKIDKILGDTIEPVQLQVICHRLWLKSRLNPKQIGTPDLEGFDVNSALADYYAENVGTAARDTSVDERTIRDWVDDHLIITKLGIRGQVLRGPNRSEGLDNRVILLLVKAHLLREEKWRDTTWYVLTHDRLIDPIRSDNQTWREQHLKPFQRRADQWQQLGQPNNFLLRDHELSEAEILANTLALTKVEKSYLTKSREAQRARETLEEHRRKAQIEQLRAKEEKKVAGLLRRLSKQLSFALFIAMLGLSLAVVMAVYAVHKGEIATSAMLLAQAKAEPDANRKLLLAVHAINILTEIGESDNRIARDATAVLYQNLVIPLSVKTIRTVFFSSDGRWLLTGRRNAAVNKWDIVNLGVTQPQSLHNGQEDEVLTLAFSSTSPDIETFNLATLDIDGKVKIWRMAGAVTDAVTDAATEPIALSSQHSALALSQNGLRLATAGLDGNVRVWELADLKTEPVSIPGHKKDVLALAFSADGSYLAAGGSDGTVTKWKIADLKTHPVSMPSHGKDVSALAFSFDGSHLAAGSSDGSLRIWEMADPTTKPVVLSGHEGVVLTLAFSPDSRRLASGGIDGSLRIWGMADPATDPIVLRGYRGYQGAVSMAEIPLILTLAFRPNNLAFGPNSYELATGGRHFMLIWRLAPPDELIKLACETAGRNLELKEWQEFLGAEPYQRVCLNQSMQVFVSEGEKLASEGEVKKAMALYDKAQQIDETLEITASSWGNLCRNGSVRGFASDVLDGSHHGSRGLARALNGDLSGAIEDFQTYITWAQREGKQPEESIAKHRQWIKVLETGESPFDSATLETLR
jgi:hypothetical protein